MDWMTVKVGDEVALLTEHGTRTTIVPVTEVSKAQFTASGIKFWRKNGTPVGQANSRSAPLVLEATADRRAEARQQRVRNYLRTHPWSGLTPEQQEQVATLILTLKGGGSL